MTGRKISHILFFVLCLTLVACVNPYKDLQEARQKGLDKLTKHIEEQKQAYLACLDAQIPKAYQPDEQLAELADKAVQTCDSYVFALADLEREVVLDTTVWGSRYENDIQRQLGFDLAEARANRSRDQYLQSYRIYGVSYYLKQARNQKK